jgi:hypothetical protein
MTKEQKFLDLQSAQSGSGQSQVGSNKSQLLITFFVPQASGFWVVRHGLDAEQRALLNRISLLIGHTIIQPVHINYKLNFEHQGVFAGPRPT